MTWTAPRTTRGPPCKRCKPGQPCGSNHPTKPAKSEGKRGPYKLKRSLLADLPDVVARSRCYTEIWTGLDIHHTTFYSWLDAGERDAELGRASLEREFYEIVVLHRRILSQRMIGKAVEAAEGVLLQKRGKDGEWIYEVAPDGRLAASIARSLDPKALPPERHALEHDGSVAFTVERVDVKELQSKAEPE